MIIKIDVDGVIRDIVKPICDIYNNNFFENVKPEEIVDYNINNEFPLIEELMHKKPTEYFFIERGRDVFRYLATTFNGVIEAINLLKEHGHKIVICTWQLNNDNIINTVNFLNDWKVPFDDLCFTRDKHIVNGDFIIDDNPEFLDHCDESGAKIIIDQPYNRYYNPNGVKRCKSLLEAAKYIIEQ